jgi:hypothetical protein
MPETSAGPSGPGRVLLDIGGDVGALIITAPAELAGTEIEVSPVRPAAAGRTHALVRERRLGGTACHAAVYPALPGGEYTVWRDAGHPAGTVVISGGAVASFRWPAGALVSGSAGGPVGGSAG